MWIDPIVEEVRENSRKWTAQFGGDIHAMCEELRRLEKESGAEYISLPPRPPQFIPMPPLAKGMSPSDTVSN